MLKCNKCKTAIEDVSDGCKQCLHFKKKLTYRDSDEEDSIPGDLNDGRKLLREHIKHLRHVHKMQLRKGADEYDPKLVDAMSKLTRAMADICKLLRSVQNDTARTLASMSGQQRIQLFAKALAQMPEADRLKVLEISAIPGIENEPLPNFKTTN